MTFSPNGTNAAKDSTATFSKVGSYTLQVTIADPEPPERIDHDSGVVAVEGAGKRARPVGESGDDEGPVGQAFRPGDAGAGALRPTRVAVSMAARTAAPNT